MTLSAPAVWSNTPGELPLTADAVHLWRIRLDDPLAMAAAAPLLSAEEAARAARFAHPADCWAFTICRGSLRELLGRFLEQAPGDLQFVTGKYGKPRLADSQPEGSRPPLTFNVAHSGDWGLIGLGLGVELGVDIERRKKLADLDQLAQRILSPEEWQAYLVQSPAGRARLFQRAWCGKEAIVKSLGQGLSYGVEQITLALDSSTRTELITAGANAPPAAHWTLHQCEPAVDYVAMLAAPQPGLIIYHWDWRA